MKKLFYFLIIIIALISTVFLLKNRQLLQKQAEENTATITLNPHTKTVSVNETFTMDVFATFTSGSETENLDYFKTVINFPKEFFNVVGNIDTSMSGFDSEIRVDTPAIANGSGKIVIELVSTSVNGGPKTSLSVFVAKITFKAISATTPTADNITIDNTQSEIVNNLSEDIVLNPPRNARYTIAGTGIPTVPPTITQIPATPTANPDLVKVGTIRFKAKPGTGGTAEIKFSDILQSMVVERGGTDILGLVNGLNLHIGAGGTPPPDGNMPVIAFKVKIRGLNHDAGPLKFKLKVKKGSTSKEFTNINAVWSGEFYAMLTNLVLTGVEPGSGYQLFIKGPKHLSRGFDNITLNAGNNTLLLTDKDLEPGDLPPQDGVINSSDISRLIELLEVAAPNNEQLATADLNFDGVINGADVNELILTLSTKYDDDRF